MMKALIADMRARGELEGIEITVDEGEPTPHGEESRDEVVFANIAVGIVNRIKAACESGKYDAVVTQAGIEPGYLAARTALTLPIAYPVHSALHMASFLGEKCCVLTTTDAQSQTVRRNAILYGLSHKVTSVRYVSRSSTYTMALGTQVSKNGTAQRPRSKGVRRKRGEAVRSRDRGRRCRYGHHRLAASAVFSRRSAPWPGCRRLWRSPAARCVFVRRRDGTRDGASQDRAGAEGVSERQARGKAGVSMTAERVVSRTLPLPVGARNLSGRGEPVLVTAAASLLDAICPRRHHVGPVGAESDEVASDTTEVSS